MSVGVVFCLLAVAGNLATWRPFSRHRLLGSVIAFGLGWFPSEFPLVALALQAVAGGTFLALGWVNGPVSTAFLVVMVASWSLLLVAWSKARTVRRVLDQALEEALGADYAARIVHPNPEAVPARFGRALRLARSRRRYAAASNVSYGPEGAHNRLDIWRSPSLAPDAGAPVLIQMPGGAWTSGSRRGQAYPLLAHLCERGWVCVAIDYRLSPKHVWPAHIVDVKLAIAWVKEHIAEHGGDPDFVVVTGGSAGGHLSALAALTANDPLFQPGFEDADTAVAASVSMYPFTDWTDRDKIGHRSGVGHLERTVIRQKLAVAGSVFTAGSPMDRVSEAAPPFFVAHGTNDSMIPVEQTRDFVRRLRAVTQNPVVYAELPGAQHAFDILGSARTLAVVEAVDAFLGVTYGAFRDQQDGR